MNFIWTFRLPIAKIILLLHCNRPDGGIGRRAGLKHQWIHFHAGSIPALGTKTPLNLRIKRGFIFYDSQIITSFIFE